MSDPPRRSQRLQGRDTLKQPIEPKQARKKGAKGAAADSCSRLLELAAEIRLLIYHYLVLSERPFMIGRIQDTPQRPSNGSPRDLFSAFPNGRKVDRNDKPNRPIQPPISRVCTILRKEVLPVFYGENEFWLIHNEFEPTGYQYDETNRLSRNFEPWLNQTPAEIFKHVQHVALCGYTSWPNRAMIRINLKDRALIQVREYSTYGDELDLELGLREGWLDDVKSALAGRSDEDAKDVLMKVLDKADFLFRIQREHISAPPGLSRFKKPASGWEYDW